MRIIEFIKKNNFTLLFSLGIAGYGLVIFFSGLFSISSTYLSILYRALFLFLALFILISCKVYKNINDFQYKIIFLIWILLSLRIVSDIFFENRLLHFSYFKYYAFTYGVSFIPSLAFTQRVKKQVLIKSIQITSFLLMIVMLSTILFPEYTVINKFLRLGTHYFHPITIGHLAVTSILLNLYIIIRKGRIRGETFFYFFNIILSFSVLILTKSRGPLIALVIVLFVSFLISSKKIFSFFYSKKIFYTVLFLICLLPLVMFQRMNFTFNFGDARLVLWKESILQFFSYPIFGSSLEILKYHTYPHNLFLEGFMAIGIVGGILITYIFIYVLLISLKLINRAKTNAIIGILFLQYFIGAMFSLSIIGNSLLWYLTFLTLANKPLSKHIAH